MSDWSREKPKKAGHYLWCEFGYPEAFASTCRIRHDGHGGLKVIFNLYEATPLSQCSDRNWLKIPEIVEQRKGSRYAKN